MLGCLLAQNRHCFLWYKCNYVIFGFTECFYDHLYACSLVAKLGLRWWLMMMLAWKKSQKILDITSKWDPKHWECGQITYYAIIGNCVLGNGHVFHHLMGPERIWIPYSGALPIIIYDCWLYCTVKGIFIPVILGRPRSSMVPIYIDLQDAGCTLYWCFSGLTFLGLICK